MSCDILYLGSQSKTRQTLLHEAGFSFEILKHLSGEDIERGTLSFSDYVTAIARHKMAHVIFPKVSQKTGGPFFIVTADTLVRAPRQNIEFAKPINQEDARRMLRAIRQEPVEVVTACCIEKKLFINNDWITDQSASWAQTALIEYIVEDDRFDSYFSYLPGALSSSGAIIIEKFGQVFLKSIRGSYSAVCGLPIFELSQTLKSFGFKY